MLTYLLAVAAACADATSSVLQRKANRRVPRKQNLSPRLIWSLLHQPVWFGGVAAVTAGFLLQATALGAGELAVVEPVLVLELPATLLLASSVLSTRLHSREWGATAVMTAALAGLLYCLAPSAGRAQGVPWYAWATGIGLNVAVIVALIAWGRSSPAGNGGGWLILPEVACGLGLAAAVVVLARSPLLAHDTAEPPSRRPAAAQRS